MYKSIAFITALLTAVFLSAAAFAQTKVNFTNIAPADGNIVIGIHEGGDFGKFAGSLNAQTNGGLAHAIKASKFDGKAMSAKIVPAPMGSDYNQILLVGLGDKDAGLSDLEWQNIGGNAVQKAVDAFATVPAMYIDIPAGALAQLAFGAKLGSYYFDKYYTEKDRLKSQKTLTFVSHNHEEARKIFSAELSPVATAMWFTRDVSNEPANVIYPETFVKRWRGHFKKMKNIKIKVIDEKEMQKLGMGALYGVGRGSQRPPRMMIVEYWGADKNEKPVVIVGKGITFDTGGISLKNPPKMWNMKFDMSGAASTMGTVYALAGRGAKVNVVGIAALAENMPSAKAQRPGDVVTSMSGKTIQIRSTDAEGRLVLADGLYYGDTMYNPPLLVNMATLTGSASRALGADYAALFSRHDALADKLLAAGRKTGDALWRLPLNANHFKAIENNVADVMNSGPDAPGASAGAAFLATFVRESTNWAHMDIAGIAYSDKSTPTKASPGSRGFGVRLLNAYIKEYYEKK